MVLIMLPPRSRCGRCCSATELRGHCPPPRKNAQRRLRRAKSLKGLMEEPRVPATRQPMSETVEECYATLQIVSHKHKVAEPMVPRLCLCRLRGCLQPPPA